MHSVDTHPDIVNFFFSGLSSWLSLQPFVLDPSLDPSLTSTFQTQTILGWESILLGLIVSLIVLLQQEYYTNLNSRKLGTRWACNLVHKMTHILHQIWLHRNSILHDTSSIDILSGIQILDSAVSQELGTGIDTLPQIYHPYFQHSLSTLLSNATSYKKQWFLVIWTPRESYCNLFPLDTISTNASLRQWIGIIPLN